MSCLFVLVEPNIAGFYQSPAHLSSAFFMELKGDMVVASLKLMRGSTFLRQSLKTQASARMHHVHFQSEAEARNVIETGRPLSTVTGGRAVRGDGLSASVS